ncbi:hypothetical protein BSL78_07544 [Apostichopus japonicus]|uniref:Reverse transcriptase domain-containing protein n=1 Tax=Stichopus japonicus TaxID=307972 RepID=A0A2G8L5I3_STIJA|nr:hypothetical protein BSL78_07544 [Apostichopus japonicus]
MVKAFYEDFQCAVVDIGEKSEWFDIKTGVKQGCNMSGFLFLTVMDCVMRKATVNGENGIRWKFTNKLDDIDFADDIALVSSTKQQMQIKTNLLADEASRVGLDINKQKTKVMRINTRNQEPILIGQEELQEVDRFVYLGATMTKDGGGMGDIANRTWKARGALIRLQKIWVSKSICRRKNQGYKKTGTTGPTIWMQDLENE